MLKRKGSVSQVSAKKVKVNKDAKDMEKIAKRVVLKLAETRSPIFSRDYTLGAPDVVYAWNLNYFMSQGDTGYQFTGEKVLIKNIHLMANMVYNGNANTAGSYYNYPRFLRLSIVKTKDALTATTGSVTASQVFRQETGTLGTFLASTGHIDLHKVKLIYDKKFTFDARDQGTTSAVTHRLKSIDVNIPINKTEFFDGDTTGYFKSGNYYAIWTYEDPLGATNGFYVRGVWSVNVKDM